MKKVFLFFALGLSLALFSCGNADEKKQDDGNVPPADTSKGVSSMVHDSLSKDAAAVVYVCPCGGCPEVKESKAGKCPKCQLELVEEKK
jgi:Heavy metal binding domain